MGSTASKAQPSTNKSAAVGAEASVSGQEATCATSFTKINDSLYELHAEENPDVEMVFFHGLQFKESDFNDAYWRAWTYRSGEGCWPQKLLPDTLRQSGYRARVLSVSYDAIVTKVAKTGRIDISRIADDLLESLVRHPTAGIGLKGVPVILVGHSVGGILIKKLIQQADSEFHDPKANKVLHGMIQNFLVNFKGVFYFSTPHLGTQLARWPKLFPEKGSKKSPILGFMELLSKDASKLNKVMGLMMTKHHIQTAQVMETVKTDLGSFKGIVVREAAAGVYADVSTPVPEDHTTICKPEGPESAAFQLLISFVESILADQTARAHKLHQFKNSFEIPA